MKKIGLVFFTGMYFLFLSGPWAAEVTSRLLDGPPAFEKMHSSGALKTTQPGTPEHERARINYLLERVSESPYKFMRNGETHSSKQAALLLRWKYKRYQRQSRTAEEFIENVASCSKKTGSEYSMKTEDGKIYSVRQILRNELRYLKEKIQEQAL